MAWLPKLKVGGAAYLVVQKNLGSDSLIPWLDDALGEGFTASKYASSKGFRIIEVRHEYEYPAELPVSAARDEIASAVKRSQVVIVSGQTGSGKTTQLPKILLELGRGTHGKQIVHTQPRRIAARTVAERIASEMGVKLGDEVGYQVRFTDESSPGTRLRVVTDGILLAQIQRDPKLTRYDTIIIDEAHERSLNIDFLLGYLTALLPQRRDLKLIITSATIDSVKFQEHFEHALHEKVPVIEVSGRTFPVQVVYEPLGTAPA